MEMYRIKWRAIATSKEGEGTATFPKKEAQEIADDMNRRYGKYTEHWIEKANT